MGAVESAFRGIDGEIIENEFDMTRLSTDEDSETILIDWATIEGDECWLLRVRLSCQLSDGGVSGSDDTINQPLFCLRDEFLWDEVASLLIVETCGILIGARSCLFLEDELLVFAFVWYKDVDVDEDVDVKDEEEVDDDDGGGLE